MNSALNELAGILEEEITVAEALEENLAAQKQALIEWNMDALLAQIEARGPWLDRLDRLEHKRAECLCRAGLDRQPTTLRRLLSGLAPHAPERERLAALGGSTREVFCRLKAEERYLQDLMETLLGQIHGALESLAQPTATTYDETGTADLPRQTTTLLRSRV